MALTKVNNNATHKGTPENYENPLRYYTFNRFSARLQLLLTIPDMLFMPISTSPTISLDVININMVSTSLLVLLSSLV